MWELRTSLRTQVSNSASSNLKHGTDSPAPRPRPKKNLHPTGNGICPSSCSTRWLAEVCHRIRSPSARWSLAGQEQVIGMMRERHCDSHNLRELGRIKPGVAAGLTGPCMTRRHIHFRSTYRHPGLEMSGRGFLYMFMFLLGFRVEIGFCR